MQRAQLGSAGHTVMIVISPFDVLCIYSSYTTLVILVICAPSLPAISISSLVPLDGVSHAYALLFVSPRLFSFFFVW